MEENSNIKIGITHGDINGIGYEVILKMLDDNRILELCTPIIYGSAKIASFYRKALGMPQQQLNQIKDASEARDGAINIINVVGEDCKVEPGQNTREAGAAAFAALEKRLPTCAATNSTPSSPPPSTKTTYKATCSHFPATPNISKPRSEAKRSWCSSTAMCAWLWSPPICP